MYLSVLLVIPSVLQAGDDTVIVIVSLCTQINEYSVIDAELSSLAEGKVTCVHTYIICMFTLPSGSGCVYFCVLLAPRLCMCVGPVGWCSIRLIVTQHTVNTDVSCKLDLL